MTEKEWVRLGGKDGVYLVEGEDYTVDREKGLLKAELEELRSIMRVQMLAIRDLQARVSTLERLEDK